MFKLHSVDYIRKLGCTIEVADGARRGDGVEAVAPGGHFAGAGQTARLTLEL